MTDTPEAPRSSLPETSSDGLRVEIRDRVAYATIDRPDRLNALSRGLSAALIDAFDRFHRDPDIWAVVLSGSGERAFCAGGDLKEMRGEDLDGGFPDQPMRGALRNVYEAVYECGVPTIAAINGWAMGAGCELALACDLRLMADHAQLGMPEAKRGTGGNFGAQVLMRTLPSAIAYELLYLAEPVDAATAARWGLVNRVVPLAELEPTAAELAGRIVSLAPLTQQRYKAATQRGRDLPLAAALRLDVSPNPYLSEDRREGVAAFVEKRAPRWQAR
jgi:enoyl-CoA hydratase